MINDPCAPLRARVESIQEELKDRQQQPPAQGGGILTPDDLSTDLGMMSDQQLMDELKLAQKRLQQCEAEQGL